MGTLISRYIHKVKEVEWPRETSLRRGQFSADLADTKDRPACGSSTMAALRNRLGNLGNLCCLDPSSGILAGFVSGF